MNLFRSTLDKTLTLSTRLKTIANIETTIEKFTYNTINVAEIATPVIASGNYLYNKITYPLKKRNLVQQKRRARRI